MAYTTIDDPSAHFTTVLSTSTGSALTIDTGFKPDWLWTKARNFARSHEIHDTTRGDNKRLKSDATTVEESYSNYLAFTSTGATFGTNHNLGYHTEGATTGVSWAWKANGGSTTTNDASATSVGTIDSVYQANTTARFSIVTYSGSGSAGTIAHGLGVTPNWVIIKNRGSNTRGWIVYHDKSHGTPEENFTLLNTTAAVADLDRMNDTAPTSTVFSVSDDTHVNNGSDTYVAYCFANVQGYSKFGSYTGNGNADGPFVYLGFKPAWVMVKRTNNTGAWEIYDSARNGNDSNPINDRLRANDSAAENTDDSSDYVSDFLSNGWKIRTNSGNWNTSGHTYIYMAFAEHPFVSSKGVPVTAR